MAIENGLLMPIDYWQLIYLCGMVIFQSHVSLPEGLSLQLKSKMEGFGRFFRNQEYQIRKSTTLLGYMGIDLVDPESIQNPVAI